MPVHDVRALNLVEPDDALAAEAGVLFGTSLSAYPEAPRRVRAGAWTAYGRVIETHNGPLDDAQRGWAAVVNAGFGAVLAA